MKTNGHQPSAISGDNLNILTLKLNKNKLTEHDLGLALLVADMFDEIVAGKDRYMIIGATSNKSAFSLTVKGPSSPPPLYAATFEELCILAHDLL